MSRPKLFLDFDNTIVDTIAAVVSLYNEDYASHEGFIQVDPKDVTSWEFTECNLATYEEIDKYFGDKRFFQRVKLYPSAGQVLRSLSHRYDITIVSHGYASNLKLKEEWVKDKLFKEIFDNSCNAEFIGVNWETHNDKSHVDMSNSIFVDDSIRNLETSSAKYKILYGEYMDWNNTNIEFIRCKNWLDLNNQICLIERF
ncbi:5' nucleotidase, NT5C type [Lachnospiraceae bacterium SGI.054]